MAAIFIPELAYFSPTNLQIVKVNIKQTFLTLLRPSYPNILNKIQLFKRTIKNQFLKLKKKVF